MHLLLLWLWECLQRHLQKNLISLFEDHFANYNKNINATINIKKNTMTGNGNTAEAVLKYIHTYQKTTGSVSMNVGSDSVSAGFTLSNVKNQWSLVCNITGIYY